MNERSTDLAAFRRLALFTVVLGAAIAGAMELFRIGLPSEAKIIGVAWLALAATVLTPLAILERLSPDHLGWPKDRLVGPAVIGGFLMVVLLGYAGSVGLVLIALFALSGLMLVAKSELRAIRPLRLLGWLVLTLLLLL